MDLTPYVDNLRNELAVAAEAGGEDAREVAERLVAPLESATRLTLLNALSAAAGEITRDLAPGSVDLRLRGLDPDFVVTLPPSPEPFADGGVGAGPSGPSAPGPSAPVAEPPTEDGGTARINFRLPEHLKSRIEEAAGRDGLSVNAWLVRTVSASLSPGDRGKREGYSGSWGNTRYTGWVQ